jgi:peptidoglycan hydrolase-like protein with peptidoglycan-binding domain
MSRTVSCPTDCPILCLGATGAAVAHVQRAINKRLDALGSPANLVRLTVHGVFDRSTHSAVQYIQCIGFLDSTGIVDADTWAYLAQGGSSLPILSLGSIGSLVATVQELLQDLHYYLDPIDGDFGPITAAAVRTYQAHHRIDADGMIGSLTWDMLSQARSSDGARCYLHFFGSGSPCQWNNRWV